MLLLKRDDEIRIIQVNSESTILPYRASFAGAYQTIYSEPPYNERFYPSEAQATLYHNLQIPENITLLAIKGESQVIGFALAVPVVHHPEVTRELRGLLSIKHSFYISELGVLEPYRRKGLAKQFTDLQLKSIPTGKYTQVVLRLSVQQSGALHLYQQFGFEDMGVYSEVSARRTDGMVRTDRRYFLSRLLV